MKASDGSESDTEDITVTVANAEDPGTVTITSSRSDWRVGTRLTFTLSDEDGSLAIDRFQSYRASDYDPDDPVNNPGTWSPIATYTGGSNDVPHNTTSADGDHRDLHYPLRRQRQMCIRDRSCEQPRHVEPHSHLHRRE